MVSATGRGRLAAGLLAGAVLAVSCGDDGDDAVGDDAAGDDDLTDVSDDTMPPEPDELTLVWSLDLHAVSRPVAAGDNILLHVFEDDDIFLVAYDAGSGEERWRRSSAAPGSQPLTDGERVYHLSPADEDPFSGEHVEAVAIATGETVWRTDQAAVANHPLELCSEEATEICVQTTSWPEASTSIWVVSAEDGAVDENGFQRLGFYSGGEDSDIQAAWVVVRGAPGADGSQVLAHLDGGEQVWERPLVDVVGDPDATGLVEWFAYDETLVGVSAFGPGPPVEDGSEILEPGRSVGLDTRSGERLWSEELDGDCGELDRLGLEPITRTPTGWGGLTHPDRLVLCALTGSVERAGGEAVSYDGVSLTVAEVDPGTGEIMWSVEAAEASALLDASQPLVRLGPTSVASVYDDGTGFVLDLAAGELREPDTGEAGWCFSTNEYDYERERTRAGGPGSTSARGTDFTTPCDLDGTPRPVPRAADEGVGTVVGDTFVWMDNGGLHAAEAQA
jgi:outer membrane protein assembly factor BamB